MTAPGPAMDQAIQDSADLDDLDQSQSEPAQPVDAAPWTVPAWCAGLVGWIVARLGPRGTTPPGLKRAHADAEAAGAILLINSRDLTRVAGGLRGRATLLIDAAPRYNAIARFGAAFGASVVRCGPGQTPRDGLGEEGSVGVLVVMPGPRGISHALDVVGALGRRVLPLTVERPPRSLIWHAGIGTPVDLNVAGTDAHRGRLLAAHHSGPGRAYLHDHLERLMDESAAPQWIPPPRARPVPRVWSLTAYGTAMSVLAFLTLPYLLVRLRAGKEEWKRLGERRGRTRTKRPDGRLVWFHAASVGESLSVLPLIGEIGTRGLADTVLLTTGTVTSARIVGSRTGTQLIHQYVPLDAPRYARRFLDHWRPDAALFVESELWPNLMVEIDRRGLPFAIVNGRLSERSFAFWQRQPGPAHAILGALDLVLAQSVEDARRFALAGARDVRHIGNLKFDSPAPPADPGELETLRRLIGGRPVWLAASTHEGEEALIADTHFAIRERFPELLTIIVPRHPVRGAEIAKILEDRWLVSARRSQAHEISPKTDVYLADTLGELGLFYRLATVAFIGGSHVDIGGHNPIEPAQLDCVVIHGPHVQNFADTYAALDALGGAIQVTTPSELAGEITDLLTNEERRRALITASHTEITRNAGSLERALGALTPVLSPDP